MILKFTLSRTLLCMCLCAFLSSLSAQNKILSTGNWNNTALWQGGNIADLITENVTFNAGSGITANVPAATAYTTGAITLQSNIIDVFGFLNIGQSGTPKNVNANGGGLRTDGGTLIIWGDVIATGNLAFISNGQIIVKGNVTLGNSGSFNIGNGANITIEGNLTGGTSISASFGPGATMNVKGDIIVGAASTSNGSVGAMRSRTCTGPSAFCHNVILPIELLQFKADVAGDEVVVKWTTATEINVDYFSIQRSVDGQVFNDIGTLKAFGNSTVLRSYSLTDPDPPIGNVYYRLHSVDFDGKEDFSNIIVVRHLSAKAIDIYPNPSAGHVVKIDLNFNPGEETMVMLMDTFGRTITQFPMHTASETLDAQDAKPGVYFLKTKTGDEVFFNRIVFTEAR